MERVAKFRQERLRAKIKGYDSGNIHERKIAEEYALNRNTVEIRGEGTPGPDLKIDGKYWEVKELKGVANSSFESIIRSAKGNFKEHKIQGLGITPETLELLSIQEALYPGITPTG